MGSRQALRVRRGVFNGGIQAGLAWALALSLVACGGGGGDEGGGTPATPITVTGETETLGAGQFAILLANDRLGTAVATTGSGGNVSFAITTGTLPVGITVSEAAILNVSAAAVPGAVTVGYRICELANTTNCATATANITVPVPSISAANDGFTLAAGGFGDVLANDVLGALPATAATVSAAATGIWPTGLVLLTNGVMTVDASAAPGSYALGYRICQIVAPSNCATATVNLTVPSVGTVSGRVVDAATALGVAGVRVSAGGVSATTDASGAFSLAGVAAATRLQVRLESDTHAEGARIVALAAGGSVDVQARLPAVGTLLTVPADLGGAITMGGSPAQVLLPPNALQRADGTLASGPVQVRMTPINPALDTALMPGDFTALVGGVAQPIESFGALNVTLRDSSGAALNLRPGQSASIRIPLATRSATVPGTIPLFFYDTASSRWVQEGTATLAGLGAGRYYEGTVTHFSTWNADQVMNTVRLNGCVADAAGARVAGATVLGDGVNYSGATRATTDAEGNFSIAVRASSTTLLVAQEGTRVSNTVSADSGSSDGSVSPCLVFASAGAGVSMKLTWGALPEDLDSYLVAPDGSRINYQSTGSLAVAPYAALDVDDTSSFGPEVITVSRLMIGTYKYAVNNYDGQETGLISASGARVELSIPGRAVELFVPPSSAGERLDTDWWLLFEFDVDARCNVTVRRVGSFQAAPPTSSGATASYCTP